DAVARGKCETRLGHVRQLAITFGLDTQPIDAKLAAMTQPAAPVVPVNVSQGQILLEKARLELSRGQTETARNLATEAHNGPYNVQSDAVAVLRSIEVEEHSLRVATACKTFDAGAAAFQNKDYSQAKAVFCQIDVGLLPGDKRLQMKDMLAMCEAAATA